MSGVCTKAITWEKVASASKVDASGVGQDSDGSLTCPHCPLILHLVLKLY